MESIKQHLKTALQHPLPGQLAQQEMMPRLGNLDRFSPEARKRAKPGAVLLLLYERNGTIYFPLTQRHEYNGAHSGQISFPGGKVELNDPSPIYTALRETEEELGIDKNAITVLGRLTDLFIVASNFNVSPVVGYMDVSPDYSIDKREVAELLEVSIDQLMDDSIIKEKEMLVRNKYTIVAPYFDFGGYHVWGATAMMLAEFKHILKHTR